MGFIELSEVFKVCNSKSPLAEFPSRAIKPIPPPPPNPPWNISSCSSQPVVSITRSDPKLNCVIAVCCADKVLIRVEVKITNEKDNAKIMTVLEFLLWYRNIKILITLWRRLVIGRNK
ncbi:hypothetical protein ES703_112437 [subsurface metagenome]